MVVSGTTLYVGGSFTYIGGQPRNRIAAFDLTTGDITPWNPDANNTVYCLAVSGQKVYAGGAFIAIGGQARSHLAALNATLDEDNATAWNPNAIKDGSWDGLAKGYVYAITLFGSKMFVTGDFGTVGGAVVSALAELDLKSNTYNATAWRPYEPRMAHEHEGSCLAISDLNLYAGGTCLSRFDLTGYNLSINCVPPYGGYVLDSPYIGNGCPPNEIVTLTVHPSPGYVFTGWSGALTERLNPVTITMNANKTVTANFFEAGRVIVLEGNLDFGTLYLGQTAQRTFTIRNKGAEPLTVSSISYPPGFSGAWSGQIPSGQSQDVTVTFEPTAAMSYGGSVTVNSNHTKGDNTLPVSGLGGTRIIRLILDANFSNVPFSSTALGTLFIWNDGNLPLTIISVACPPYFSGNWNGEIAPGTCQAVTVAFTPDTVRTYTGTVTVTSDALDGTNTIDVTGNGVMTATRRVRLKGDLAFGATTVNTTVERTLTIYNDGNAALTVTGIACPSRFSGDWSGQIEPGKSKAVTMTFTPDEVKAYSGTVTVNCNSTSGVKTMDASGTGTPEGVRVIRLAGALDCRSVLVGTSVQRALIIYNEGTSPLTVNSITLPDGYSGDWSGVVAPGTFQAVRIVFSPTAVEVYEGDISVSSDKTGGTSEIPITGRGTNEVTRVIRLTGDLAFGHRQAHTETERTLTIHNDGSSVMTVDSIQCPTPFYGGWVGQIPSGESKDVTITFIPDENQDYSNTLRVISNATSGPGTITVSGTTKPESRIVRLTGDLAFGSVTVNTAAQRTLTIHNDGNVPLTLSSIGYPNGFSGAWAGEIAAGGSQDVTVTFAPTAVQAYSGNVTVSCNSTSGTPTCAISGTGSAVVTEATATISNAWWSDHIDTDGDGYQSSMKLWCKPDVAGGSGSLTVHEKIYYRASGQQTWTLCAQTNAHTLNGTSAGNMTGLTLQAKSHGAYDYRIEVYRNGQSTPDHTLDSTTSSALSAHQEELSSEDQQQNSGPSCAGAKSTKPTAAGLQNSAADLLVLTLMLLLLKTKHRKIRVRP